MREHTHVFAQASLQREIARQNEARKRMMMNQVLM
jgi:hypothetical protein